VVDVVGIFLGLLPLPTNPVEVVLLLLLFLSNLARRMVVGVLRLAGFGQQCREKVPSVAA
jgi:hypothetical protein